MHGYRDKHSKEEATSNSPKNANTEELFKQNTR